jgi:hypothetical protein
MCGVIKKIGIYVLMTIVNALLFNMSVYEPSIRHSLFAPSSTIIAEGIIVRTLHLSIAAWDNYQQPPLSKKTKWQPRWLCSHKIGCLTRRMSLTEVWVSD